MEPLLIVFCCDLEPEPQPVGCDMLLFVECSCGQVDGLTVNRRRHPTRSYGTVQYG